MDGCVYREGVRAWAGYSLHRDVLEVFIVRDDLAGKRSEVLGEDSSWRAYEPFQLLDVPTITVPGYQLYRARVNRVDPRELVRGLAPAGFEELAVEAYEQATEVRV